MGRKKPVAALGGRDFGGSGGARSSSNISSPNRRGSGGEASQQLPTAAHSSTSPTEVCSSAGAALTFSSCRMETRSNTSGSCGGIQEVNKGNSSSSSSTNHAGSSTSSVKGGDFVSDALLRDLEFEDFSRASCWEQLQHELVSCLRSLPIAADRSRFLQQVAAAHAEAAAAAAAAAPVHAPACMHRSAYCSSSWHAYAVPPPQFACLCSSPLLQQQQQRCALSLPLFSPLVLQQLVPIPRPPNYSRDSTEIPRDRLLRLTYTCSPPLPELGCCCSSNSSRNDSSSRRAYAAEPPAEVQVAEDLRHWSPSLSPIFFDSSSSGCGRSIRCSSSDGVSTNNKELRCGTCAACTLQWEQFFPSRAPSIQRSFGVSEFLQLETVRLPDASGAATAAATATGSVEQGAGAAGTARRFAAAAAAVSLPVSKETARAALAALGLASRAAEPCQQTPVGQPQQEQQELISQLPLFCVYDPQHEDCVGAQVLRCVVSASSASAAAASPGASPAAATTATQEEAGAGGRERSAHVIRHYDCSYLSSAFSVCDLSKFLLLLLPHLGAELRQKQQQQDQQHPLFLLQQLTVTAQYTYFLLRPWQQTRSSSQGGAAAAAAAADVLVGPEAWWLHETNSTFKAGAHSSSRTSSINSCIISEWREVAVGASTLPLEPDGSPAPSADSLLQLLLLQRCPVEALHVIWCSPLQPLRDFWSSSSSSTRPLAASFDCRLRLNLSGSLLRAHEKLLQHPSLPLKTLKQKALHAADFLQEDAWQQQCAVTSRVHQLSRLLLLAGSSNSNSSSIKQQPFVSLSSKVLCDLERTRRRGVAPHSLRMQGRYPAASKRSRWDNHTLKSNSLRSSSNSSSNSSSSGEANEDSAAKEAEAAAIDAEVQQLFRPMTRQQQLLIHEQQVKRLLLTGSSHCSACSCCCSACGCCGLELAFGLLWGSSSSSSFFAELALCAGKQQHLNQLQRLWQQLMMQLRWMWDRGLLLPRVVAGLTAATATACAAQAAAATAAKTATAAETADAAGCEAWSALAAGLGVACCPDGPSALPDVCCCSLQQLLQQLNCAAQQQRLQWLLQDMPKEQQQQPFESLRFVLPPPEGLSHLHEPILPILPPVTENTLAMHAALLRERRSDEEAARSFGDHCGALLRQANKGACTPQASAFWWQHCFARLPRSVEQLLHQREQLLQQQRAVRAAAATAVSASAYTHEAVLQAARAAAAAAVAAVSAAATAPSVNAQKGEVETAQSPAKADKQHLFFNCLIEGEGALHGLESLTAPDLLGQLLRLLVASLAEQCRLACACVLASSRSQRSRRCIYTPGVAAAFFGDSSSICKGRLFPCHIPALQAAADDLQRHAVAHSARAAADAANDQLAWLPPLPLLAACMRCEFIFSAAAGLCRLCGTDPPALAIVNRALQLLLLRLQQQEQTAAAAAAAGSSSTEREDGKSLSERKLPEAECDILVPILSCSEKRALQKMLSRCHPESKTTSAATSAASAAPWEAVLPWPPFAQEFVLLLQPHTSEGKQQDLQQRKWAFYCRAQHSDSAFAVTGERCFH